MVVGEPLLCNSPTYPYYLQLLTSVLLGSNKDLTLPFRNINFVGPLIPMFKGWSYVFSNRAKSVTATLDSVD